MWPRCEMTGGGVRGLCQLAKATVEGDRHWPPLRYTPGFHLDLGVTLVGESNSLAIQDIQNSETKTKSRVSR